MEAKYVGLLTVLGSAWLITLVGCTPEHVAVTQRWDRRFKYPDDYNTMPLGTQFDTPAKVEQLADERLRAGMLRWLELREDYLKAWRNGGEYDDQVLLLRNRRQRLMLIIQDLAANAPRPLTKS